MCPYYYVGYYFVKLRHDNIKYTYDAKVLIKYFPYIYDSMSCMIYDEGKIFGHLMQRYCVTTTQTSSSGTFAVEKKTNVLSEIEETGNRGDSDVDGDLAETLDKVVQVYKAEKR